MQNNSFFPFPKWDWIAIHCPHFRDGRYVLGCTHVCDCALSMEVCLLYDVNTFVPCVLWLVAFTGLPCWWDLILFVGIVQSPFSHALSPSSFSRLDLLYKIFTLLFLLWCHRLSVFYQNVASLLITNCELIQFYLWLTKVLCMSSMTLSNQYIYTYTHICNKFFAVGKIFFLWCQTV